MSRLYMYDVLMYDVLMYDVFCMLNFLSTINYQMSTTNPDLSAQFFIFHFSFLIKKNVLLI